MPDQPDIVPFESIHRAGLLKLWARYFGNWSALRLNRLWSWQFETNPFTARRPPRILVGVMQGQVVGHMAGIPLPLRYDGQSLTPLFAAGLVADESHRWLGFRLARALIGEPPFVASAMSPAALELFTRCGASLVDSTRERFTLPRSYAGALSARLRARAPRLGRAVPQRALRLAAPWYRPSGEPPTRRLPRIPRGGRGGHDIRRFRRLGPDYDALWSRVSAAFPRSLDKTSLYMNWRYLDCPTIHPVRLALHERGRVTAVAVGLVRAGLDASRRPCIRHGEITEFIADDPASPGAEALLSALLHALDRWQVDSLGATSLFPAARPLLERLGLTSQSSNEFAMAVRLSGIPVTAPAPGAPDPWYYTAGDGDSLYCSSL